MGMRCRRESFRRIWIVSIARGLVRGLCEGEYLGRRGGARVCLRPCIYSSTLVTKV
jgi:hypothetical protein